MIRSPARAPRPRVCAHVSRMCVPAPGTRLPPRPGVFLPIRKHRGVQGGAPQSLYISNSQVRIRFARVSCPWLRFFVDLT